MKSQALFFYWIFLSLGIFFAFSACSNEDEIEEMEEEMSTSTFWIGDTITFEKPDGADPTDPMNQDRITDAIWITRGNEGGQIYNIKSEEIADQTISPAGTEWAQGQFGEEDALTFAPFREAVRPNAVVGKDLILHLIEEDIYISVRFTKWSGGKLGGFAYQRSTE
ncbi:MAG: hypothetical protein AAF806_31065 [Bacteroidota bacterium]